MKATQTRSAGVYRRERHNLLTLRGSTRIDIQSISWPCGAGEEMLRDGEELKTRSIERKARLKIPFRG